MTIMAKKKLPSLSREARISMDEGVYTRAFRERTKQLRASLRILEAIVADDAFSELCQGIGEEPSWLKDARKMVSRSGDGD